ncbi:hypothetical protein C9374_004687 [Naegleria lovaniensis]|uniref:Uncharacterized protein n=1 Tax=Naegleria lovaniensis TaxID=51637 RepID=A0AA88GN10_NAELO|nr:uncharacterized protein C9374_004687 [Naegleria lovaniensis]KAG2383350.1 hypothetical protein C9374_004687 [Naegleria lovaniensis]
MQIQVSSSITSNQGQHIHSTQKLSTTATSSRKDNLLFLTQSLHTIRESDIQLLTEMGKKQQQSVTGKQNRKEENMSGDMEEDENLDNDDDGMNDDDEEEADDKNQPTKKIKN